MLPVHTETNGLMLTILVMSFLARHANCIGNTTVRSLTLKSFKGNSPVFMINKAFNKQHFSFDKLSISRLSTNFARTSIPVSFSRSVFKKNLAPILRLDSSEMENQTITETANIEEDIVFRECSFVMTSGSIVNTEYNIMLSAKFIKCSITGTMDFIVNKLMNVYINDTVVNDVKAKVNLFSSSSLKGLYRRNNFTNIALNDIAVAFRVDSSKGTHCFNTFSHVNAKMIYQFLNTVTILAETIVNTTIKGYDVMLNEGNLMDCIFYATLTKDGYHVYANDVISVTGCCFSGDPDHWIFSENPGTTKTMIALPDQCAYVRFVREVPYKIHKNKEVLFKMPVDYYYNY